MTPTLQLEAVDYLYGDRTVLKNVSLSIAPGSCTALIGPNGVGKTTLLRLATGSLTPASGRVLVKQQAVASLTRKERARLVALVPQQLDLSFDFTVEQIVEQGRSPYLGMLRGPRAEDRRAVDRAMDLADVTVFRHRIFNELSGGERQRVKIALGLAQEAELLLLDEPTQNLDIGRQVELIDLLHHLRGKGFTILASIHDLHLLPGNFDQVILMEPGHPLTGGTPEQVLTPQQLTRAFRCAPGRHPLLTRQPMHEEATA